MKLPFEIVGRLSTIILLSLSSASRSQLENSIELKREIGRRHSDLFFENLVRKIVRFKMENFEGGALYLVFPVIVIVISAMFIL
jgi:hypothetical protein